MSSPFAHLSMITKNTFIDVEEAQEHDDSRRRSASMPPSVGRGVQGQQGADEVVVAQLRRLDAIVREGAKPARFEASPTRFDSQATAESPTRGPRWSSSGEEEAGPMVSESPSLGSAGHAAGTCRPCAFARSSAGCKFGDSCNFCHLVSEHPESVRMRPCKGKRERFKRTMAAIEEQVSKNPDLLSGGGLSLPAFVDRNPQARARVMAQLAQVAAEAYRGAGSAGALR